MSELSKESQNLIDDLHDLNGKIGYASALLRLEDKLKELEAQLEQYKSIVKTVDPENLPKGRVLLNDNGFVTLGFLDFNKDINKVRASSSSAASLIVDDGAQYIEQKDLIKLFEGVK